MRVLYIFLPLIVFISLGLFLWNSTNTKPLSLSPSDIVITEQLQNIVSSTPTQETKSIKEELGYYKTDLNRPVDAYYPFAGTDVTPQLTTDELGLEHVGISASLKGIDTSTYTLLHLPTFEEVIFDNGQVIEGRINYVESEIKNENLYVSFYRGAVRDYENPESKIRQEMQRIKLVRQGVELKKVVPFDTVTVDIPQDQYIIVTLSPDLRTSTVVLNKKIDSSFKAYLTDSNFNKKTPFILIKFFPSFFGTEVHTKIAVNGDKQGWEIENTAGAIVLLLPN